MSEIILGIIGSGQLGSLLCHAAKKLNVKTRNIFFMKTKYINKTLFKSLNLD